MTKPPFVSKSVERFDGRRIAAERDLLAVEEPLQIIVEHGEPHARQETPLAITMRTPGHDLDLVRGFLYAEGVIGGVRDIVQLRHCLRAETPHNVVRAVLQRGIALPNHLVERRLSTTSACGVCGERTIDGLAARGLRSLPASRKVLSALSMGRALGKLDASQPGFRHTGGTHGAALFDAEGELVLSREDVGRHNALDKLVGAWLESPGSVGEELFVVVSSRASFELVQKTVCAGFPVLVALGAASSLAVDTARELGLTLVGFAKEHRFNIYSRSERIAIDHQGVQPVFISAEG